MRRRFHRHFLLFLLLSGASFPPSALAHPFLQNSWWVVTETNRLVMRVSATLREVAVAQQLDLTRTPFPVPIVQVALSNHANYVAGHLSVRADAGELRAEVLDYQLLAGPDDEPPGDDPAQYLDRTHAVFDLEFRYPKGNPPHEISFGQATLREHHYAPGVPWDVTYSLTVRDASRHDVARGLVRTDLPFTVALDAPTNRAAASADPANLTPHFGFGPATASDPGVAVREFTSFVRHGLHHVLTGYDHLLFLSALALAAVRWRDLIRIIALFTLAHSLTVTVAALGWLRLPSWIIEPIISGSIIYVALENVLAPERAAGRTRWLVAFGFGLVHGLGFAGGLQNSLSGEPSAHLALVIVAFCLGVELGHLAVGGPLFGVLQAVRRGREETLAPVVRRWGSVGVACGGAYFLWAALRQI